MSDVTYCAYSECENKACVRNIANAPFHTRLSIGSFRECDYFKKFLKELAREEEAEMWREALDEAHDLDGGHTLKAKVSKY